MASLMKTTTLLSFPASLRPILAKRLYATQTGLGTSSPSPHPRRKAVTAFNDDGKVAWGDLSKMEKVARTTQQSFNLGFILLGATMTAGVAYIMYTEVFSLDSKTAHFNRAFDRVREDPQCVQALGNGKQITAYGEPTFNKWARARPIASNISKDRIGAEHLVMHFNVDGPKTTGVVHLHMIKRPSDSEFVYRHLYVDVRGQQRIWIENADNDPSSPGKNKSKLFGISWR